MEFTFYEPQTKLDTDLTVNVYFFNLLDKIDREKGFAMVREE